MRPDDFFADDPISGQTSFRCDLVRSLRSRSPAGTDDAEVASALARLVHDELERYGTGGGELLSEHEMREALLALRAVVDRLDIRDLDVPFRDYSTFRSYWLGNGASGSWQARRDILATIFNGLHDRLSDLETRSLSSTLADPVSPHARTGWPRVDTEIAELRRHFQNARTPQDYRGVGNDCIHVTEALSATVYDRDRHLRPGETEPPAANTKQRLDRYVEDTLGGSDNAELRKLVRAAIELAQAVKHREMPTRCEAGIAADAVILLANILRRLEQEI